MKTITKQQTKAEMMLEIDRLTRENASLSAALKLVSTESARDLNLQLQNERLASENAHLLARLGAVDPQCGPLLVELRALGATYHLCRILNGHGYQQAVAEVKAFAREIANPMFYDALNAFADKMQMRAEDMRAGLV